MREKREISPTGIYHVILRGNNKQLLFFEERDYRKFLDVLESAQDITDEFGNKDKSFLLYSYCLMSNHVHLLVKTKSLELCEFMKKITVSYAEYYNRHYERVGHVFQDRFRSEVCDSMDYFQTLLRYIHQNPVKAGICQKVEDYRWSSWHEFSGKRKNGICNISSVLNRVPIDELTALVNENLADDVKCLDYVVRIRYTDSKIAEIICEKSSCASIAEFQRLPLEKIVSVMAECGQMGISTRSLSRVTGQSYGFVYNAINGIANSKAVFRRRDGSPVDY